MKTEQEYFEEGQTIQEYMDNMSKLKEESFQVYENFKLPDDGFAEQLKDFPVHFLIITEDWCGDAMRLIRSFVNWLKRRKRDARCVSG